MSHFTQHDVWYDVWVMATNLDLDPALIDEAVAVGGRRTKKEAVTEALVTQPHGRVVLDCTDLRFIDSSGLRVLIRAHKTAKEHQVLLAIKGFPGREHVSVGELAGNLHLKHHSAVGLVDRLSARQLVRRDYAQADRRRVEVRLTPRGEALLRKLSAAHLAELRRLGPELRRLLDSVTV